MKHKHVKLFEQFVNEDLNESVVNEASEYTYKEDSGGGKPTWVLKLGPGSWQKVKHLFDKEGRPTKELKNISAGRMSWDLYALSYQANGKEMHRIYGASGDWTFGNAPTYYQQKHRGNKRAAKQVFDWFIKKYLD